MRMMPFEANKLVLRLQKVVVPVLGSLMGGGKGFGDLDVKEAAQVIAMHLDESLMDSIVLPMFGEAKVYCVENKKFIRNGTDINQCFTTENLFDLYELIYEIGRYQFTPFFTEMVARFGFLADDKKAA
jgi:hypothetical protein